MSKIWPLYLLLTLFFWGCNPRSQEDFHLEGQSLCRSLTEELQSVHKREDLIAKIPALKKKFHRLVDLMLEARATQIEGDISSLGNEPLKTEWSESLRLELQRIYAIEGGKELIEEAQRPALLRLDQFERELLDKKSRGRLNPRGKNSNLGS